MYGTRRAFNPVPPGGGFGNATPPQGGRALRHALPETSRADCMIRTDMHEHGIARPRFIGARSVRAAAAARRSHNLLICPPPPAAYRCRVGVPLAPQQRFAGSPRPAQSPPTPLGGAPSSSLREPHQGRDRALCYLPQCGYRRGADHENDDEGAAFCCAEACGSGQGAA